MPRGVPKHKNLSTGVLQQDGTIKTTTAGDGKPLNASVLSGMAIRELAEKRLDSLENSVTKLGEMLSYVVDNLPKKVTVKDETPATLEKLHDEYKTDNDQKIPTSWIAKKNEILGPEIDMKIESSNRGFILYLYLPDNLDRRTSDRNGKDHSTGFIRLGQELSDVEALCTKVKGNIRLKYPEFLKTK